MIKIILIDTGQELDLDKDVDFAITFSIADVRDINSRNGAYSKTIQIKGTPNNNLILSNYFDINVSNGTFDVNKECKITVKNNDETIFDGTLTLLSVKKKENNLNTLTTDIVYEVQLLDTVATFFKTISTKYLKDIKDLDLYNHKYNVSNITQNDTFSNTWQDVWKYVFPWISTPEGQAVNYELKHLYPGFFVRALWDRIHNQGGVGINNNDYIGSDKKFNSLLIPYSGDAKKLNEKIFNLNKTKIGLSGQDIFNIDSYDGVHSLPTIALQDPLRFNINNSNPDNKFVFPTIYYNNIELKNPNKLNIKFSGLLHLYLSAEYTDDFDTHNYVEIMNLTSNSAESNISTQAKLKIIDIKNAQLLYQEEIIFDNINVYNGTYSDGMNFGLPLLKKDTLSNRYFFNGVHKIYKNEKQKLATKIFNVDIDVEVDEDAEIVLFLERVNIVEFTGSNPNYWGIFNADHTQHTPNRSGNVPYYNYYFEDNKLEYAPITEDSIIYNSDINLYDFLPDIKQSDLIKSICQMFNLYPYLDKNSLQPNTIRYYDYNQFYNPSLTVDWTDKLCLDKEQQIQFTPELIGKKIILKYKDNDKDELLDSYKFNTNKSMGQVEITFKNENIKNIEEKEVIFSPTFNVPLESEAMSGILAPWFGSDIIKNTTPRILIDNGNIDFGFNAYVIGFDTAYETHLQKFNTFAFMYDIYSPYNQMTLEYVQSDYYPYEQMTIPNNLYFKYWQEYMYQIDNNKMLNAYFWLNDNDIANMNLRNTVIINGKPYRINKVIDYQPNKNQPTKVELLTVE